MDVTVNRSTVVTSSGDDVSWHTTQASLTQEEEDAIVTLVVIVIGVIAAIIILFSMGIFIDCRHQKKDISRTKKRLRLKIRPRPRNINGDGNSLASEMCPNGNSELSPTGATGNAIV